METPGLIKENAINNPKSQIPHYLQSEIPEKKKVYIQKWQNFISTE